MLRFSIRIIFLFTVILFKNITKNKLLMFFRFTVFVSFHVNYDDVIKEFFSCLIEEY